MPATRCLRAAAARSTPRSPRNSCWAWSSRNRRAWAAAPSCWCTTRHRESSSPTTDARPRRRLRGPIASSTRRQAAALPRRGRRRPVGRRARHDGAARGGASRARPPALGRSVRAGDRARGAGLRGLAAAGCGDRGRAKVRWATTAPASISPARPGNRCAPAIRCAIRPTRARCARSRARARARSIGARSRATSSRPPTVPRANPGDLTLDDLANYRVMVRDAGVRTLSRLSRVRHAAAVVGRADGAADARDARALRPRGDGAGVVLEHAFHREAGRLAYADRSALRGRSRLRCAAGRAARSATTCASAARRSARRRRSAARRRGRLPRPRGARMRAAGQHDGIELAVDVAPVDRRRAAATRCR